QLVAAGEEDAAGLGQALRAARLLAVAAGVEVHDLDPGHPHLAEQRLVVAPALAQAAGGGNDHDVGVGAAAQFDEARQDARVGVLVLGAADRNDPAALLPVGGPAWHLLLQDR